MTAPSNPSSRAFVRLLAVAVIAVLAVAFSCRPAWSPDGKRLLFTAVDDGGRFVASYDRETGKVERVLVPPVGHDSLNASWSADGKRALVLSGVGRGKPAMVAVSEVVVLGESVTSPEVVHTQMVSTETNALEPQALVGAVIVDRNLFFSIGDIVRVNLDTGDTKTVAAGVGERLAVVRRGDGLAYISFTVSRVHPQGVWQIGALDPETLHRKMLLRSQDYAGVSIWPRPSFSPDLDRVAMPSQSLESIVVFREGKIELTLPLGPKQAVWVNDLVWSRHGDKIFATLCRMAEGREAGSQWSLFESTVGGSVQRETVLFDGKHSRVPRPQGESLGLSISPDGKVAAVTTAHALNAAKDQGLYLVDLTNPKRTVTKVGFPASQAVTLCGSDLMLSLAQRWSARFRVDHPGHVLKVRGGGTGTGLAALRQGDADLSMAMRLATKPELDQAKQDGVTFEEHCIVRHPAAICVHKDSAITALTVAQLAQIFAADGATKWSELGFEVPEADNDIIMATHKRLTPSHEALRVSALARRPFAHSRITPENDEALVAFAAIKKGAIVALDDPDAASRDANVKLVPIARDAASKPCLPTDATIADGSYPLVLRLFVYSRKGAPANVSRFLGWLHGEAGVREVRSAGYRPAK
tara:strand:+ start:2914 stop:4836 length:1923 start_codon:yes stop_codon:yes gene_type:complete